LSVCGGTEDKLYSASLVSGFRKCGIVPFNRNEVLAHLPLQEASGFTSVDNENDTVTAGVAVLDAVLKHLKTMRYGGDGDEPIRRKQSEVSVEPGCSIAYEELDAGDKGPKSRTESSSKKKPCKEQSTAQHKRERSVERSDDGSLAVSDDDSADVPLLDSDNSEEPQLCSSPSAKGSASALPVKSFYKQTVNKTANTQSTETSSKNTVPVPVPVPVCKNRGNQSITSACQVNINERKCLQYHCGTPTLFLYFITVTSCFPILARHRRCE